MFFLIPKLCFFTTACNGHPKTAINDARLAPTPKPEVEIWRKPHKRTRSTYSTLIQYMVLSAAVWPLKLLPVSAKPKTATVV